jgi:hypothetical protein
VVVCRLAGAQEKAGAEACGQHNVVYAAVNIFAAFSSRLLKATMKQVLRLYATAVPECARREIITTNRQPRPAEVAADQ